MCVRTQTQTHTESGKNILEARTFDKTKNMSRQIPHAPTRTNVRHPRTPAPFSPGKHPLPKVLIIRLIPPGNAGSSSRRWRPRHDERPRLLNVNDDGLALRVEQDLGLLPGTLDLDLRALRTGGVRRRDAALFEFDDARVRLGE